MNGWLGRWPLKIKKDGVEMKHVLLGIRKLDFNGTDGRPVKGYSLFVANPADGVNGMETSKIFVREVPKDADSFLNTELDVVYNQKGRVVSIDW